MIEHPCEPMVSGIWKFCITTLLTLIGAGSTWAQQTEGMPREQQIVRVDRGGAVIEKIGEPQVIITGTIFSPDQKSIAFRGRNIADGNDDIWIYNLERKVRMQVTFHPSHERQPCWSPDGRRLVYFSYRNGPANLYMMSEQGGEEEFLITAKEAYAPTWSSDGKYILYHQHDQQDTTYGNRDLWYVDVKARQPIQFTDTPTFKEAMPRFSPDGRYVSYMSDETGTWEAYVKAFPNGDKPARISSGGGVWPRWNGKGDELYFWQGNSLMVVPVTTSPTFSVGQPKKLFTGEQTGMGPRPAAGFNILYDVAADGQSFLVVQNSLKARGQ